MLRLVVLGLCLYLASANYPHTESCLEAGETAKVSNLTMAVSDCLTPERCLLVRDTTYSVTLNFKVSDKTDGLKMYVYGRVLRIRVPYVRGVDLCANTTSSDGTTCLQNDGLVRDKTYSLVYPFYIRSQFPEWKVPVEFELWDKNVKLDCIRVNVQIKCNVNTESSCRRDVVEE